MDEDYELWALLTQTRNAIFRARQKALRRYNISSRQCAILFVAQATADKATPAEISRWLIRESHSVSGIISRMEKQGLVRKVHNFYRKNMVRVVLTEKGHEVYSQSTKMECLHRILPALSRDERQLLRSCLLKLRDKALEELGVERKPPYPPSQ